MAKSEKLDVIKRLLLTTAQFLQKFLPLVNAHNCDFITRNLWSNLLTGKISDHLLLLSQDELNKLLSCEFEELCKGKCPCQVLHQQEIARTLIVDIDNSVETLKQLFPAKRQKWDKSQVMKWDSDCDLDDFITKVRHHIKLIKSVIATCSDLHLPVIDHGSQDPVSSLHIPHGMTEKKSHEIKKMTEVCASLVKLQHIAQVVDIGSGRGYLGCQLSLMYGLKVLGIDSSLTNTQSAERRTTKVQKYWPGLMRKAKKNLAKSEKNEMHRVDAKASDVVSENDTSLSSHIEEQCSNSGHIKDEINVPPTRFNESDLSLVKTQDLLLIERCSGESMSEKVLISDTGESMSEKGLASDTGETMSEKGLISNTGESMSEKGLISNTGESMSKKVLISDTGESMSENNLASDTGESMSKKVLTSHIGENMSVKRLALACSNKDSLYVPITFYVTPTTDIWQLICTNYHTSCEVEDADVCSSTVLLTGLHTCGDLASSILRLFTTNGNVQAVCNVGCCYHHIEEEFVCSPFKQEDDFTPDFGFPLSQTLRDTRFQLGRNARMLACQCTDRLAQNKKLAHISLYWRALLQVILYNLTGELREDWQVGKIAAKCADFTAYVKKALVKLKLPYKLSDDEIIAYEVKYQSYQHKMKAFFQLKAVLAPAIELFLLVDRLCFLLEQDTTKDAHLVKLFDEVISPRCYAIIAVK